MRLALKLAQQAQASGEVPVGAVIVYEDTLIGQGYNQPIQCHDATAHAEIMALRDAGKHCQNYRLPGSTLYVTLEPCVMCAGAIVHARLQRVVYATREPKTGAAGSCFDIFNTQQMNHFVHCEQGLLAEESQMLLQQFFQHRRLNPKCSS